MLMQALVVVVSMGTVVQHQIAVPMFREQAEVEVNQQAHL